LEIVWGLAKQIGMPKGIANMKLYEQLERHISVGRHLGPGWRATNSMAQGCSLSLRITNLQVSIWARILAKRISGARVTGYIDDRTVRNPDKHQFRRAPELTCEFDKLTGAIHNMYKITCSATKAEGNKWLKKQKVEQDQLNKFEEIVLLGAQLKMNKGTCLKTSTARGEEATTSANSNRCFRSFQTNEIENDGSQSNAESSFW